MINTIHKSHEQLGLRNTVLENFAPEHRCSNEYGSF